MTSLAQFMWSDDLTRYIFGPHHPMSPIRLELTVRLARELGVWDFDDIAVVGPATASDDELELVHSHEYVAAVKGAGSSWGGKTDIALGTDDVEVLSVIYGV